MYVPAADGNHGQVFDGRVVDGGAFVVIGLRTVEERVTGSLVAMAMGLSRYRCAMRGSCTTRCVLPRM